MHKLLTGSHPIVIDSSVESTNWISPVTCPGLSVIINLNFKRIPTTYKVKLDANAGNCIL